MAFPTNQFTPGMISTPDPRLRIPPYAGSPMRGIQSMYQYPYSHPMPLMTPIVSAQPFGWDPSNIYGQNMYNPYGSIPYSTGSLYQGSQRFFPIPQTNTTTATQEHIASGSINTKSVTFSEPSTSSSWETQIQGIYQSPLGPQTQESGTRLKDGTTQTVPSRGTNLNQSVQTDQIGHTNFCPVTTATAAMTAVDLMFSQPPIIHKSEIKATANQEVQTSIKSEVKTAASQEVQTSINCHSCKKDDIDPPTFNGKDKWDTFVSLFEKVADFNNWENAVKCKRLMIALRGNALEFVDTLQLKVTKDYDSLKSALAQRFGVTSNESLYRVKFQGRRKLENETLDKFIQDLQYLAERAYPNERGSIYHRLIIDQFVEGIGNRECKNYLQLNLNMCKETNSGLIQEVLKYAHNYESVMGTSEHIRKPYAGAANVIKQNNHAQPSEENRNRGNHWNPNNGWRGPSKIICYKCREEGHIASRCPLNEQQNNQGNGQGLH